MVVPVMVILSPTLPDPGEKPVMVGAGCGSMIRFVGLVPLPRPVVSVMGPVEWLGRT